MKRLFCSAWFAAAMLCLVALPSYAGGLLSASDFHDDYLPVEQAFQLQPLAQHGRDIRISWDIAPGYYLYRHALKFKLLGTQPLQLGKPSIPTGHRKHDDYFGEVETYSNALQVSIPLNGNLQQASRIKLQVKYQGCADAGLCYPPQTRTLTLNLHAPAANATTTAAPAAAAPTSQPAASDVDLATQLARQTLWLTLLQFFGFGLLLAFTPCVLPMLPILAGVIAGSNRRGALHGFTLALAYVLAMALAYTLFGVVAALLGHNLQAMLQTPAVVLGFAAVFIVLALSMFGLFHLGLPSSLQTRLSNLSARQRGGSHVGAAIMGFIGALIVGPCVAAPLAGALLYIARTGDPYTGGAALFSMGLGMGLPLLLLGVFEGRLLPRAGSWMTRINQLFGFLLLGVAIWLASRIMAGTVVLSLWAAWVLAVAAWLLWQRPNARPWRAVVIAVALALGAYAGVLAVGAAHDGRDPLRPLQQLQAKAHTQLPFHAVSGLQGLQAALAAPGNQGRILMLDFYADWCVSCRLMERDIFPASNVQPKLLKMGLLRADLTDFNAADQALLQHFQLVGPPALLFFKDGKELRNLRMVGEPDAAQLAAHLQRVLQAGAP